MATTTSSYLIGIVVDTDTSQVTVGMQQAETAVQGLATTTQTAAADIDTALATDVPASADTSAVNLTTKASKFKAVGTELGTSLTGGLSQGLSGPEALANTGNSLSGLIAASATTAAGAIAAVGIGAGVAVVTAIAKGMNDQKERVSAATAGIFDEMEIKAGQSLHQIRQDILSTFSLQEVVTGLGGGDFVAGWDKVEAAADAIGTSTDEIAQLLTTGVNPATKDTYEALIKAREEGTKLHGLFYNSSLQMDNTAKNADELLKNVQATDEAMKNAQGAIRGASSALQAAEDNAAGAAKAIENMSYYSRLTAEYSERTQRALASINQRNGTGDDVA